MTRVPLTERADGHEAGVFDGFSGALQVDGYRVHRTERDARADNRRLVLADCW